MTQVSFPHALAECAERDPDAIAIICDGRSRDSRGELDRASNRMARAYEQLGVTADDFVTISLPNSVEWFVACMAAWRLGAIPNPVSPRLPPAERDAILEHADPRLVVGVDPDELEATGARRTAIAAGFEADPALSDAPLPDVTSSIERALASGGSTGRPKLILTKSPAIYDPNTPFSMFTARAAGLIPGPLYHGIPFASSWRSLFGGATVVVMPRFDASQCLELVERHHVDRVAFVPTMMHRIARLPESEHAARDVSSLEFVMTSSSPCPAWLMQFWIDWLGPEVMHESFGSTERIGGTFISGTEWLEHPGSVGKPVGGTQIRILDPDTKADRATGEMGEIYMLPPTGPQSSYSYIGAEARTTVDGWESVGDMGYVDADGYLYIGDRRDDMILCGGRNIFPAEIEAAIDSHPDVRSSTVIGLPDEDLGQSIHTIVEADGVSEAELAAHVRGLLVSYKVPGTFEFVHQPLRDDSGKVRRSRVTRDTDRGRDAALTDADADPLIDSIRTVVRLARIAQQACEEVGLTLPQYRALNSAARGRRRAYELARYSAVSRPAMSALTAGLEKMKLLERSEAETDGRGVYFVATRKGRKTLEDVEARMTDHFREILGPAAKSLTGLRSAAIIEALDRQADREFGPSDDAPRV